MNNLSDSPAATSENLERLAFEKLMSGRALIEAELGKVIVGQRAVVEQILIALIAGGHCLITGAPGLAKTLLVNSMARIFALSFQRIQFTPDLMPADITGTEILQSEAGGARRMAFVPGPVFANIILADEINRTPPKTQAALLEAMQERRVTLDGTAHALSPRFLVVATQNPIESQGVYPLPEAQLDRFLFKLLVGYPGAEEEAAIVARYGAGGGAVRPDALGIAAVADAARIDAAVAGVAAVTLAQPVADYIVRLVRATRETNELSSGASPRAAVLLAQAARARAALDARDYVVPDDVKALAPAVLRHRLLLSPVAEIEGRSGEAIVGELVERTEAPR